VTQQQERLWAAHQQQGQQVQPQEGQGQLRAAQQQLAQLPERAPEVAGYEEQPQPQPQTMQWPGQEQDTGAQQVAAYLAARAQQQAQQAQAQQGVAVLQQVQQQQVQQQAKQEQVQQQRQQVQQQAQQQAEQEKQAKEAAKRAEEAAVAAKQAGEVAAHREEQVQNALSAIQRDGVAQQQAIQKQVSEALSLPQREPPTIDNLPKTVAAAQTEGAPTTQQPADLSLPAPTFPSTLSMDMPDGHGHTVNEHALAAALVSPSSQAGPQQPGQPTAAYGQQQQHATKPADVQGSVAPSEAKAPASHDSALPLTASDLERRLDVVRESLARFDNMPPSMALLAREMDGPEVTDD